MQTETHDLIEIQAVGSSTRKRGGESIEALFLARASIFGFAVSRPWGDSERYDFVVDSERSLVVDFGHCFWRVQVKSTARYAEKRYRVKASGSNSLYTRDEIDFIVVYLIPEDLWYIVPIEAMGSQAALRFYPHGNGNPRFEKYREAWCLLACSRKARGWKDIPIHCRRPGLTPHCAVCPLREA
jgi:hypothetical protein